MVCMKCRAVLPDDARFCFKCGSRQGGIPDAVAGARRLNFRRDWGRLAPAPAAAQAGGGGASYAAREAEHLLPWLKNELIKSFRAIPKRAVPLAIFAGVVLLVNILFWTAEPYFLPAPLRAIVSLAVFLTATYNDVVPKTVFWVIVFTLGGRLLTSIRSRGALATFGCLKKTGPELKSALGRAGEKAYGILAIGAGLGLALANNFASYSRFSEARNKIDKFFVVLVVAFAVSYLLGEARKTGLFKFVKLGTRDACALAGKAGGLSDDGVYVLLSGFVAGLILDLPLALMGWKYGGYILGALALIAGAALLFTAGRRPRVRA